MRRTFLSARPSRAVFRAFGEPQSRRTFATPPTKDDSPPSPIEPSKTQAHPVGPFYEAVLRTPQSVPQKKPEEPPVTSQQAPADEDKAAADEDKGAKSAPKRTRKPRQTAAAASKDETPSSKAKSVPSSSSSSFSSAPSSSISSTPPSSPSSSPPPRDPPPERAQEPPSNTTEQQQTRRITFGASLAGPTSFSATSPSSQGELIAGVLVPPRPQEPDNCCMSGCVNCVWDRYRDEMDLWADRTAEAERRVRAAEVGEEVGVTEGVMDESGKGREVGKRGGMDLGVHEEVGDRSGDNGGGVVGMEDDGGGSMGNWEGRGEGRIVKDFWDEELYKHVPVGIREFMKQEKRLKEKHRRQGTLGG